MKISIRVIPNAKKSRVVEEENSLKVYVTAPPADNKGLLGNKVYRIDAVILFFFKA